MAPIELDPIPDPVYPDGGKVGAFDASGNIYEAQELLHRPHAFALMHGKNGAKVAYGELHYIVNSFKLKFETSAISVADHDDHSHAPHDDHSHGPHSDHTDHSHSSHTTSNHQHTHAHTHNVEDHTHSCGDCGSGGSGSGSGSTGGLSSSLVTQGASPETTGSAGTETLSHSGVQTTGPSYGSASGQGILEHSAHTGTKNVSDATQDAPDGVLKHTGVRGISDGFGTDSSAESGVLSHTVSGQKIFCSGASQESLGNITQKVPRVKTEGGELMDATINEEYYHELDEYGDVYLCWKVDLEDVGNEVTKCWVQVGEPDGDPVIALDMGNATTNRRNSSTPHTATGQKEGEDAGVYRIKLGSVTQGSKVIQYVSSDVVWQPTVLDREQV